MAPSMSELCWRTCQDQLATAGKPDRLLGVSIDISERKQMESELDARLKQIGESLKPGSSAIIAVIDHVWVAEVERQMQTAGADTVTASLSGRMLFK